MTCHNFYTGVPGLLSVLLGVLLLTACQAAPAPDTGQTRAAITDLSHRFRSADARNVVVVAHRGCWAAAPENSIAAIEACIDLGVSVAELDVRSTADGVLVLMHDHSIDRTTTGSGAISKLTFSQVRGVFLKDRKGGPEGAVTSQRVPTFKEALLAAKGRILVNLDAKEDVYQRAFEILEQTGTIDHVIMKRSVSPADPVLDGLAPFDRVIAMPVAFQDRDPDLAAVQKQLSGDPDAVEVIFTEAAYGEKAATLAHGAGVPAWVNTLGSWSAGGLYDAPALKDPESVWGKLIGMGYSIIQTDEPRALLKFLNARDANSGANNGTSAP